MGYILLIVESPAKCKKIEDFLGPGYKCIASFGHLRELTSLNDINLKGDFGVTYHEVDDTKKRKHIQTMRSQINLASEVLLATDDDREGEAIAWHICILFGLSLTMTKRIIFHEVTKHAIVEAVNRPIRINLDMVYAQQARQILDLIVGFKVSPKLWENIVKRNKNSLSAGRCQSPALRIIYDNQKEVETNPGEKIYNTTGYFTKKCIPFDLNKQYTDSEEMYHFLEETASFSHVFTRGEQKLAYKQPPTPLTTSRLQQVASNEIHCSPKETMSICQKLYEGGYISYMRTDSKKYSKEFIEDVKKHILQTYNGEKYIHDKVDNLANNIETTKKDKKDKKENLAQEAHEAIRPTNISLTTLPKELSPREHKMYKIIRETTLESCMSPGEYWTFTSYLTGFENTQYANKSENVHFLGWQVVKDNAKTSAKKKEEERNTELFHYLFSLEQHIEVPFVTIVSNVSLKNSKQHYTEAKLVQMLEERGIGRPSTYSSLVDKIQERGYVKKQDVDGKEHKCIDYELADDFTITQKEHTKEFGRENNKLVIQPLGTIVIEFLISHFNDIFNYEYTSNMEEQLDKISKGEYTIQSLCRICLDEIDRICNTLPGNKLEIKIDDCHTYIIGKYGPVIKCVEPDSKKKGNVSFKPVRTDIDTKKLERNEYTLAELLDHSQEEEILHGEGIGKYKDNDISVKKGKYGLFARWGEKTISLKSFGNRPMKNISLADVVSVIEDNQKSGGSGVVRNLGPHVSIRSGKYGDYIFYKKPQMKKPSFFKLGEFEEDYKSCDDDIILSWIKEKYNVE